MKILLLNNPWSGRGAGAVVAADLADRLRSSGHTVNAWAAGPELDPKAFRNALRETDLLVVAGGDGTLHHALPAIIETGVKFYHFPLGTENLFTREFRMTRAPDTLLKAITKDETRRCDAATCNGRPFSLMIGVGFDACVVERLAAGRRGGTSRGAYVRVAALELLRPRVPRVSVWSENRLIVDNRPGMLLVANSRQYAAGLNPAHAADMSDGQLDIVFYPHKAAPGLLWWLAATSAGMHTKLPGVVFAQASHVRVETFEPAPVQIDGEAAGLSGLFADSPGFGFEARVLPGALNVLLP
jgi:diacylglycerol kinase (ATP)